MPLKSRWGLRDGPDKKEDDLKVSYGVVIQKKSMTKQEPSPAISLLFVTTEREASMCIGGIGWESMSLHQELLTFLITS